MKEAVVLYPLPAIGHLVSMVELAKLFLLHDFSVTVVLMDAPISHPSIDSVVARVSSAYPSISFHRLPPVSSVPDPEPSFIVRFFDVVRLNNPQFLHFVAAHSQTYDVRAVVLDFFCSDADVTAELRLPSYFFWSSGAAALALFLYIPTLHFATHLSFKDLDDAPLHVPGLPPVSASHMPHDVMDRNTESYKRLFLVSERGPNADGLLINTFESMEVQAVRALRDGSFIPGRRMPPVYCIGPLVADWSGDDRVSLPHPMSLTQRNHLDQQVPAAHSRGCDLKKVPCCYCWAVGSVNLWQLPQFLDLVLWVRETALLSHCTRFRCCMRSIRTRIPEGPLKDKKFQ
ncbi:hypothetical protein OPV22_033734 [Ensete ventricosum]|uniref:Uncharacterized protein n=1 Tax=Ensete ventricosum TaxID=4639 RepID=A0AAV8PV35_ENSVE|nr:hypothetical protein OPV22_033734 [Ensete ventricosum]